MLLAQQTHVTVLLRFLINTYFTHLSTVLVVHDAVQNRGSALQQEYLNAVEASLCNQSSPHLIAVQWIDVSALTTAEFERQMAQAVEIVTEGFITILVDTKAFLHARYYATRNAQLRLKDKYHLFLCEWESPQDLLASELLQFYPHHLMIVPERKQMQTTLNKFPTSAGHARTNASGASIWRPPSWPRPVHGDNATIGTASRVLELWTQKFVGDAGNLNAVRLDAFLPNETFAGRPGELYPNKLSNLEGRTVRTGSITYIPYVVTNYVTPGSGNVDGLNATASVSFLGSEAEVVKTFCMLHNCSLRVRPFGADNWGVIYANGTSTAMMGDLYTQRVELAIGCIYNWYDNLTETSHTIARSSVTFLGPAPAKFPAWRTNIMPFETSLWLFLITMMVLCTGVLYTIQWGTYRVRQPAVSATQLRSFHVETSKQNPLNIFAIFVQQPTIPIRLRCSTGRFFIATLLCATITLENTYSGQLKSILTIPFYTEPVDTMHKWAQTTWSWGAPASIWVQTLQNTELLLDQILTGRFEIRDYKYLYDASFRSDYGLAVERLVSGAYTFGDYITMEVLDTKIMVKDDLYFDWTRAVAIRGWPLMPHLNRHVRTCIEAGLYDHWERRTASQYLDRQIQEILLGLTSGHTQKMPPQRLTVANISGALFALLFGYLIALLVFAMEVSFKALKMKSDRAEEVVVKS